MTNITEDQMVDITLEERAKFLGEIRVLDKVKSLVLLPNTELMTTRMVAEWFEVSEEVIRDNIRRNKSELEQNGVKTMKHSEIKGLVNSGDKFEALKISPNGSNMFTLESLIVLSFLLRKSRVAEDVRLSVVNSGVLSKKYSVLISNLNYSLIKENSLHEFLLTAFDGICEISRNIECGHYWIDFVVTGNGKKIAIECDEYGHSNYSKEKENERARYIRDFHDAIVRYNPDGADNELSNTINKIIKELLHVDQS